MRKSSIAIIVIVAIVAALVSAYFAWRYVHGSQCDDMLFKINELKGSVSQGLLNKQGVNAMIDQYNAQCAGTTTNFANNPSS